MTQFLPPRLWALVCAIFCTLAQAEEPGLPLKRAASIEEHKQAPNAAPKAFYREFYDDTFGSTRDLWQNGEWGFVMPLWTVHMRWAYSKEQRNDQNNNPHPAIGVSKGKYLPSGNWHSLFAAEFQDSWDKPSWMAGYNYNWLWRSGELRYGLGAITGLMMRNDYFGYRPFPFILPSFQLSYGRVALEAAYVPGVKRGTGNVALLWLRIQ